MSCAEEPKRKRLKRSELESKMPDLRRTGEHRKKPRWSLLPWEMLEGVVRVLMEGADRPGRCIDDWKEAYAGKRDVLFDKMCRHLLQYQSGIKVDPDSGEHPLDHLMAMALIAKWHDKNGRERDSRCTQ